MNVQRMLVIICMSRRHLIHCLVVCEIGSRAVTVELERIDQEITVEIEGVGLSLVNNISQTDVMYLGITRSGSLSTFPDR